jgi:hypothetical protein
VYCDGVREAVSKKVVACRFGGLLIAVAVTGLLSAGCGGDDGEGDDGGGNGKDGGGTAEASDIGFTFDYPSSFKLVTQDEGKVLLIAQLEGDNRIAVRKTSDQPILSSVLLESLRAQFKQQVRDVKPFKDEKHAGKKMRVLELNIPADNPASGGTALHSVSYFFVASGKTWQLECSSHPDKQRQVTEACIKAVDSIKDK